MSPKKLVMWGMIIGSSVGGYIPALWGDSFFSGISILFTFIGGVTGIYLGYKLGKILE